ncbi:PhzF family phenazine biosynthesis protein [Phytomonospora sp. NPDC050363]|uniref:PhzF family phenazine biosynthesis protein n=1 Tax=Phytomonospora sp. NPDC050363 TaxID=3155642 RepID=UPI00340316B3
MSPVTYEIVDVFTDRPYTGNPLAVVFGAERLDTERLQAIAREFNLSETAFVLPVEDPAADYRVRIFTPGAELPFAGHPSIGTAVTLLSRGRLKAGRVMQECAAGLFELTIEDGRATLDGTPPSPLRPLDAGPLLAAAGLTSADLAGEPYATGSGLEHHFLPVRPDAVARAVSRPRPDVPKVYLFSWDAERRRANARLFAPGIGITEDPATGSAALGLGAYLTGTGLLPSDGVSAYTIDQGEHISRPSILDCEVAAKGGVAIGLRVTGRVAAVAKGELVALPH